MEKTISEIQKEVKIFELMKANEMTIYDGKIYYEIDNTKIYRLGIVIDGYCISLQEEQIFEEFENIEEPKIDQYYVFNIYDYGTLITYEYGSFTIKENPNLMKQLYEDRMKWYMENRKRKKQKVISFEKVRKKKK